MGEDEREVSRWRWGTSDPTEKHFDPAAELSGRIHSLIVEDGLISVDFGSAATEALFDLLLVLSGAGVREIILQTTRA